MKVFALWFGILIASPVLFIRYAGAADLDGSVSKLPPGTTITNSNWQQYREFLADGMVALFEGKYFWKMPADVAMEVGPTIIHPLPAKYLAATEKYSQEVKIVELPDGGLTLQGYRGGIPFPNPQEPHRGWKILANMWFRYMPHLMVDTYGAGCGVNSSGQTNCFAYSYVINQLSFNTDPGVPEQVPNAAGKYFTEWFMFLEPEQERYTATLQIDYTDPTRPEDLYVFLPSLRRYQPMATSGRCAPNSGTDATAEDFHFGFDSNITTTDAKFIAHKKLLMLVDAKLPTEKFPGGFDMPLGWPRPSWGKWQLRDVDIIAASKIPSRAAGYCYGKRVMYIDSSFYAPLWQELYDAKMQPWKFEAIFPQSVNVPGIGPVDNAGSFVENFWDIQNNHATFSSDPAEGRAFYVNEQAPGEYKDLPRYTTPAGLNMIMR